MTVYDDQILTLPDFSIVFISETVVAVTQHVDKLIETEKLSKVNFNKVVKKGRSTMGVPALNIIVKGDIVYIYILEKRYILSQLFEESINFDNISLLDSSKYLIYKKNEHFFISLKKQNFLYVNPRNIVPRSFLFPVFYFKDVKQERYNEIIRTLSRFNIPNYTSLFEGDLKDDSIAYNSVVYKNDFNNTSPFYFTDDPTIEITTNNRKPIITYGFSRNNSRNYFDVNICNSFDELKTYIKSNLNYNKHYFNHVQPEEISGQLLLRNLQLSLFLPVLFIDFTQLTSINSNEDNQYLNSFINILNLRQKFIPFLYSTYKETRFNNTNTYTQYNNYLIINKKLIVVPIYKELDEYANQSAISMLFDDTCYDFNTGEKYLKQKLFELHSIETMPIFALEGSIIPLFNNEGETKNKVPLEYDIKIFPGESNNYTLYYDEYVENNLIKQSISTFDLNYSLNDLIFTVKTNAHHLMIPKTLNLNFVNIKKDSSVTVKGSKYNLNYIPESKTLVISILEVNNDIEIEIFNNYGLEVSRKEEFLNEKLENFFSNVSCRNKDRVVYKYKIKPFLHESKKSLLNRVDRNTKFIPVKQRKYIHKIIEMYKFD